MICGFCPQSEHLSQAVRRKETAEGKIKHGCTKKQTSPDACLRHFENTGLKKSFQDEINRSGGFLPLCLRWHGLSTGIIQIYLTSSLPYLLQGAQTLVVPLIVSSLAAAGLSKHNLDISYSIFKDTSIAFEVQTGLRS